MLDITSDDVKKLNDKDLRNLIGLLCEAELYSINNKTGDVMYGGDQDEPDDGIDVMVRASKIVDDNGFILRNNTIFQVKKTSMPPGKINQEMLKDGVIRECIKGLNDTHGAYIIISSGDDLTQITYRHRIDAMTSNLKNAKLENIKIDFYDASRIATWVRCYPSLICWVNDKLKKNINGWTSYCNWSSRDMPENEFIMNDDSVIYKNNIYEDQKIKMIDGINSMREDLLNERSSVRLAGLSGVGKTRLAQALFDSSFGKNPLNREMVIYGDISDSLSPEPVTFIKQLEDLNKRIILIVDNCEPAMHNKLTSLCQRETSKISLMTIEYDVKEDDNVDSNNYYLGTASKEVLSSLLKKEYKDILDINIETIVNCSDGNFRIAIYLAKSISKRKNIGILNSDELFNRLFYQGKYIDKELLNIGEACSLFYSFDTTYDLHNEKNELNIISKLAHVEPIVVFQNVSKLLDRLIIQKRGDMRALLPHALANKLAIDYLKKNPIDDLLEIINNNSRLSVSFFRRLKYLHLSSEAQSIAEKFLSTLTEKDMVNADKNLLEKIRCVTILNPEKVLDKIESIKNITFFSKENVQYYDWMRILSIIAYEENLFKRSINIIIKFALTEKKEDNYKSIKNILYVFFHLHFSCTHAPLKLRLEIVDGLIKDKNIEKNQLGINLVNELLLTREFICVYISDVGSKLRDYGIEPSPTDWYIEVINYCDTLLEQEIYYSEIEEIIIDKFTDLVLMGFYENIEKIVVKNIHKTSWSKLWIPLLAIKKFHSNDISSQLMQKINILIKMIRPSTTKEKILTYLCNGKRIYFELDDIFDDTDSIDTLIYNLGVEIGKNKENFIENMKILDDNCNLSAAYYLAKGIYEQFDDIDGLINSLLDIYDDYNKNIMKHIIVNIVGLYHDYNSQFCSAFLDFIIKKKKYKNYYTFLQLSYNLDDIDVNRFIEQIKNNNLNEQDLYRLEFCINTLSINTLIKLLENLPNNNYINDIIIKCLWRYLEKNPIDNIFKDYTRTKISNIDYSVFANHNYEYEVFIISKLIKSVFSSTDSKKETILIFDKINTLINNTYLSFNDYSEILIPLIELYPIEFLNVFIDYDDKPSFNKKNFIKKGFKISNIIFYIQDNVIIEWLNAAAKAAELSYVLEPYIYDESKECYSWSPLGKYLINTYYNNEVIINNLINNIYPQSWSGNYSDVLKKRINLFKELMENSNPIIKSIGEKVYHQMLKSIEYYLKREEQENAESFNSFEPDYM